jgi:cbb3-type cytochrome oxidase subunit 3
VDYQTRFTLVNGITALTSVIVGFSGAVIGIMFREANEKRDNEARMFLFKAIILWIIPFVMLWTTYYFLTNYGQSMDLYCCEGGD